MTTYRAKDPAGLLGDQVSISMDGAPDDLQNCLKLLKALSPTCRIDALRQYPELLPLADSLEARLREPRSRNDPRTKDILRDIERAEHHALYLKAAPKVIRDNARQAGTKKQRRPDIQEWIDTQVKRTMGGETAKELWARAPEEVTDAFDFDRFVKRVTEARKKAGIGRK